ncbi:MAG: 8-oxo-dGTP diphosphatase [Eubacteriales bacterium]
MQFSEVRVMNVIMIYDMKNDTVLLQDRTKRFCGGSFPGGHLENGESVYDSCIREIKEETGLTIESLVPCGMVHWNKKDSVHEFIFCYRTSRFSGTLCQCEEGRNYWVERTKLAGENLTSWFRKQLPIFFASDYTELSHIYDEETDSYNRAYFPCDRLPSIDDLPRFEDLPENRS